MVNNARCFFMVNNRLPNFFDLEGKKKGKILSEFQKVLGKFIGRWVITNMEGNRQECVL